MLVEGDKQAIIGLKTCMKFGLINRVHVINKEVISRKRREDFADGGAKYSDWVKEYKCSKA